MQNWERALAKFLVTWKPKKEVIGAIVCGSYVTGNPSSHSDIDLHIILADTTKRRERGNEIVDGFLIEYFANPLSSHHQYDKEDFADRRKIHAHMLATGKIVFDKTGALKKLIRQSQSSLAKPYPKMTKAEIELAKYHVRDMRDNVQEVYEAEAEDFFMVSHVFLYEFFGIYAKFLQFDAFPVHKLRRLLANSADKQKYCVRDFPDQDFVHVYLQALASTTTVEMFELYRKITDHICINMGGFEIDGRKVRTPAI